MSSVEERGQDSIPKGVPPDRLTIVEQIYHRPMDEEPTLFERRYSRELETRDEVYQPKKPKVGQEWQPVDTGWLGSRVGMLIVANEEGKSLKTIPSPEELAEIRARVVEVSYAGCPDTFLVPPGESFHGYPSDPSRLRLRCRSGVAKCVVLLIPE